MKGFVFGLGKSYFIVAMALGVAAGGDFGLRTLTDTLSDGISQIMTGDSDVGSKCLTQESTSIIGCKIDQNLVATQSMIGLLDGIDTADDDYLEGKITQARWFAGLGTAGPAVVAGTLLIVFRIAMALFVGFAPIFILCLLFKKTAPLFQKWLYYGLATIFSGVMLGVMSDISMDLVTNLGLADAVSSLTSIIANSQNPVGIMQTVTQQLGLGLLLSTLLITVPPMAGFWFNGVMGNYSGYGVFDRSGAMPARVDGGRSHHQQVEEKANQHYQQISKNQQSNLSERTTHHELGHHEYSNIPNIGQQTTDTLKSNSSQPPQSLQARTPQPIQLKPEEKETK